MDIPSMRVELTMKKKEEFNLVEDFINQWENHPDEQYRAYFHLSRKSTAPQNWLWTPEIQTTDKIFFFIPDNRVYTDDTLVEIHKDSIVTYKLPSHTTPETPSDDT
jgi:hypothetical protein